VYSVVYKKIGFFDLRGKRVGASLSLIAHEFVIDERNARLDFTPS
jgi:hypothetical protein